MSLLSAGACAWLNKASPDELDALHAGCTVQLLGVRKLVTTQTQSTKERYRVILSDGIHFTQAMLVTDLNDLVYLGDISRHAIVVLDKVVCHFFQDKRLLVILDLHVLSTDIKERIGNPVVFPWAVDTATGS